MNQNRNLFWILKQGFKACVPYSFYAGIRGIVKKTAMISGGVKLGYLVVSVGQACNFYCQDCGNLAPYSPLEYRRYRIEDVLRDLSLLFSNLSCVECLQIQGGEPFLYTDLFRLVSYLGKQREQGKVRRIVIATNGSMMPSDEMLGLLKEVGAEIRISDYGIVCDRAKVLQQRLEERGIENYRYEFVNGQSMWYQLGGTDTPREDDTRKVRKRFENCSFRGCLTLEHGELAYCSRATNSFSIQGFDRLATDYLKIGDSEDFREQLIAYLASPHFMEACRYCNGTNDKMMVRPAIQIRDTELNR